MVYKTQSDKQWSTKHKATSNGLQSTKRQAMVYKTQSDKQWFVALWFVDHCLSLCVL
jgi:hypothetical protein